MQDENDTKGKESVIRPKFMRCKYHTGRWRLVQTDPNSRMKKVPYYSGLLESICLPLRMQIWTCCGGDSAKDGCSAEEYHTFPASDDPMFQQQWQYHHTPHIESNPLSITQQEYQPHGKKKRKRRQVDLQSQSQAQYFKAVALDCEMGTSIHGDAELIRLTAIDFFTGAVLLDSLVSPTIKMLHYNTRYSGVTRKDMDEAIRKGTCIFGRDVAREKLWEVIGPETIVVTHGGNNDMTALRWIHPHLIDTFLLEMMTGMKIEGGHSLKNLCAKKLGLSVQNGRGHDSLEDALACRELCHYWAELIPDV